MHNDNAHMDQFFRESLKGFRQKPPAHSWDRLKDDLERARRHRRIVLFRWTAAAAVLLLAFLAGYYLATINIGQQIKENPTAQSITKPSGISDGTEGQQQTPATVSTSGTPATPEPVTSVRSGQPLSAVSEKPVIAETTGSSGQQETMVTPSQEPEIATVTPAGETPAEEQPVQPQVTPQPLPVYDYTDYTESNSTDGKWSAGGSFAPVFAYRNISIQAEELPPDVNPDENYYNESEEPMYSYSGGLDVMVRMAGKWEFQTGLYLTNLGQINQDVVAWEEEGVKDLLKVSSSTGVINIVPTELPDEFVNTEVRRDSLTDAVYINSNIYQTFTYIEVPLLVRYALLDKRVGIRLTGGLSPGFMTDNNAHFTYEGQTIDLDREGEFYSMIYNSVVSAGLRYNISGSLSISLDPTFKYSLNSIRKDHSIEYHPYSISVFTGIRFTF